MKKMTPEEIAEMNEYLSLMDVFGKDETEPSTEAPSEPVKPSEWSSLSKSWVRLPTALLHHKDLTLADVVLVSILIDLYGSKEPPTGAVSRPKLCTLTGFPMTKIYRSLQNLRKLNLIETESDGRKLTVTLTGAAELLPPKRRKENAP